MPQSAAGLHNPLRISSAKVSPAVFRLESAKDGLVFRNCFKLSTQTLNDSKMQPLGFEVPMSAFV